jgi:hypothetical protein
VVALLGRYTIPVWGKTCPYPKILRRYWLTSLIPMSAGMSIWVADYNQPQAMKEYALARGVPDEDIVLDFAGRRTGRSDRDTCYRAGYIFGVKDDILVIQWFRHAPTGPARRPRALLAPARY